MKIVIPGGTGQVGAILDRALTEAGHEVVVLTRRPARDREVWWDGENLGSWAREIDGSDVVINLAGRSVELPLHPGQPRGHDGLARATPPGSSARPSPPPRARRASGSR